jgi:pilus assembly protein CpaB
MKRRLVPLLGVAFVVAVISTGVFYGLIVGKMRTSSGQPRPIVVAAGSLPRGTVLDKTHVKLMPLSGRAVPEGAFTDPDQVTGLTVLQNIEPDQPITQASLSSRDSAAPSAQAIPEGLRAVSIRVTDSPGVVAMLHAGYKVDVQAVRSRGSGETELHTVLQDVEVLTVQPESAQNRSGPGAVITLLAKPEDADVLGVADAGGRIRLVLRNPSDRQRMPLPSLPFPALFHPQAGSGLSPVLRAVLPVKTAAASPKAAAPAGPAPDEAAAQVQLRVQIVAISPSAAEELRSRLAPPARQDLLQVCAFRPGWSLESAVESLRAKRQIEVLSASTLLAGNNHGVSMQAGAHSAGSTPAGAEETGVRIQFVPSFNRNGTFRIRVAPEVTSSGREGVTTRKIETEVELSDGQGFLVAGLADSQAGSSLISRLFPGRTPEAGAGELLVLATPRLVKTVQPERRSAALIQRP